MPSLFPREIDDAELRTSLSSLLGYRVLINGLSFFPAEDNSDYAQVILRIGLRRQTLIQPEEYQGLCAILLRYFRADALTPDNITIRDDFKILSLDKRHWVIGRFNNGQQITEAPTVVQDQMPDSPWHPKAIMTDYAPYQQECNDRIDADLQTYQQSDQTQQGYYDQHGQYHPHAPKTEHGENTESPDEIF